MSKPYRVITVCTGNICRSPMAEYQLRSSLPDHVLVSSAGTTGWEAGNPIDPRAAQTLHAHGIGGYSAHIARAFTPEDFGNDLILALNTDHFSWLLSHVPDAQARDRIRLVNSFSPNTASSGIADPWYGNLQDFEKTYTDIDRAIPGIARYIESGTTP